jgi:hypothetical protein
MTVSARTKKRKIRLVKTTAGNSHGMKNEKTKPTKKKNPPTKKRGVKNQFL